MKESKVWLLFNLKHFQVAFKLGRKQLAGFSSRVQSYDSRLFTGGILFNPDLAVEEVFHVLFSTF